MKEICIAVIVAVVVSVSAFAWNTELPSATTSTLGENEKREMLKANIKELRDVFTAYTSAH